MKILRKFFDKQYELLEKTNTQFLKPAVDAGDAFFFGQPTVTNKAPHIRDGIDVKRYMILVLFAVLPCAVFGVFNYGLRALAVIIVSYAVGGLVEMGFCILRKEEVTEGFLITGILYPLILPPTIPLWMVGVGVAFGVIIGKEIFGGSGKNIFNPALIARCFIYICFPVYLTGMWAEPYEGTEALTRWNDKYLTQQIRFEAAAEGDAGAVAAVSAVTPIVQFKTIVKEERKAHSDETGAWKSPEAHDAALKIIDQRTRSELPSLSELFWGKISGSIGESCKFLVIIGGLLLIVIRVASWRTVLSCIVGAWGFCFLMNSMGVAAFASPEYALLSGGFLFGVFFMATDPVSAPITRGGKFFYGGMIGVLSMLIRYLSGFPEGIMFAIILMNIFSPLIDIVSIKLKYRKASS